MGKRLFFLILIIITLSSCSSTGGIYNTNKSARKIAPSGKFRNPTMFSRANPFQGRAKAKLTKSKKKKKKFFKKKQKQSGTYRKAKKPGRTFGNKRTISRKRMRSSGSRSKSGGGRRKSNKNLFNTRKK